MVIICYSILFTCLRLHIGPYTVFAPSDDAIAQLPREVLERILDDEQFLIDLLKYHVVSGRLYSTEVSNDMTVPSLYQHGDKQVNVRFNFYPPRNVRTS